MEVFFVILLTFQIINVNSYTLKNVPGVDDSVPLIDFDSNGNIYAISLKQHNGSEREYALNKLSPEKELLSRIILPSDVGSVELIRVTSTGDAYLLISVSEDDYNLAVFRSGSETIEVLDVVETKVLYLDPFDNLYYSRERHGVLLLRPGSNTSIAIKNLENYYLVTEITAVDQTGNIYMCVKMWEINSANYFAVITNKELQNEIPTALRIDVVDQPQQFIEKIVVDQLNGVWIVQTVPYPYPILQGDIKKLRGLDDDYRTIIVDFYLPDFDFTPANDRIWVVGANRYILNNSPEIFYLRTSDSKYFPVLQNLTQTELGFTSQTVADKDGRAYFITNNYFTPELGSMIFINPGEVEPISVKFNGENPKLLSIALDRGEDVWIVSDAGDGLNKIYVLKKAETTANSIEEFKDVVYGVFPNPVTNETFVGSGQGLLIAVNEK